MHRCCLGEEDDNVDFLILGLKNWNDLIIQQYTIHVELIRFTTFNSVIRLFDLILLMCA